MLQGSYFFVIILDLDIIETLSGSIRVIRKRGKKDAAATGASLNR